ncbi:helix-turn-helix transcriptional regulator [Castellaniella caeni]|uniref:helix-turn-helix transcriptional regulator n=1 Tax=Castellaniella caeni TaxID=266123 RepID=UPI000833C820|nr:helix-turn-helix transcriptional regulator [Castellaniella caeni]
MSRDDAVRRQSLGAFLRSARARVSPADHGLPPGLRRRTPGLRREEIAQLCDISTTWYTWIEQGREVSVSVDVWDRLAQALHLTRAERHYLFSLAECADPQAGRLEGVALPEGLGDCVDSIRGPAYILDQAWNMLAWNAALERLFDGWPAQGRANLLQFIFLNPAARTLVVDWEERASRVVAEFRADVAALAGDETIGALVAELQAGSPLFAHCWTRQTVVDREGGVREFQHPAQGRLRFRQFTFRLAIRPDCKLVMLLENLAEAPGP